MKYIKTLYDAETFAECLIANTSVESILSEDVDDAELNFLSAIIMYLVDIAGEEFCNMSTLLWLIQQEMEDLNCLFDGTKKIVKENSEEKANKIVQLLTDEEFEAQESKLKMSMCTINYNKFLEEYTSLQKYIAKMIYRRLMSCLSAPGTEDITEYIEFLENDSLNIESLRNQLTCLFVEMEEDNRYKFWNVFLLTQIFKNMLNQGENIKNFNHLKFVFNDFCNIGKIPDLSISMAVCGKFDISMMITCNSALEIQSIYGDMWHIILRNCNISVYYGSDDELTKEYFSNELNKIGDYKKRKIFKKENKKLTQNDISQIPSDMCIVAIHDRIKFYTKKYM